MRDSLDRPRICIFGDRPGPRTDPKRPMFPHTTTGAAANLARLMGISLEEYVQKTDRTNVWSNGNKILTRHEAIARMDGTWAYWRQQRDFGDEYLAIVVGNKAAEIMFAGLPKPNYGEPVQHANVRMIFVPHTSGLCRIWNDPEFRSMVADTLGKNVPEYL